MRYLLALLLLFVLPAQGAMVLYEGRMVDVRYIPHHPPEQHFVQGMQALRQEEWHTAFVNFHTLSLHFPAFQGFEEAVYLSGVAALHLGEFPQANEIFSRYILLAKGGSHFEEVMQHKFEIAEALRGGARTHLFNIEALPNLMTARGLALEIYDEVAVSLPGHDLAARSLFGKAKLEQQRKRYKEALEGFQQLVRRFPRHECTPEAYLAIAETYLAQLGLDRQNHDLLALSQVNAKRFQENFPGDVRLEQVREHQRAMRELYAGFLYETGTLYERRKWINASKVYYREAVRKCPDTASAQLCQARLEALS